MLHATPPPSTKHRAMLSEATMTHEPRADKGRFRDFYGLHMYFIPSHMGEAVRP